MDHAGDQMMSKYRPENSAVRPNLSGIILDAIKKLEERLKDGSVTIFISNKYGIDENDPQSCEFYLKTQTVDAELSRKFSEQKSHTSIKKCFSLEPLMQKGEEDTRALKASKSPVKQSKTRKVSQESLMQKSEEDTRTLKASKPPVKQSKTRNVPTPKKRRTKKKNPISRKKQIANRRTPRGNKSVKTLTKAKRVPRKVLKKCRSSNKSILHNGSSYDETSSKEDCLMDCDSSSTSDKTKTSEDHSDINMDSESPNRSLHKRTWSGSSFGLKNQDESKVNRFSLGNLTKLCQRITN